jgi:hypothetical protein
LRELRGGEVEDRGRREEATMLGRNCEQARLCLFNNDGVFAICKDAKKTDSINGNAKPLREQPASLAFSALTASSLRSHANNPIVIRRTFCHRKKVSAQIGTAPSRAKYLTGGPQLGPPDSQMVDSQNFWSAVHLHS